MTAQEKTMQEAFKKMAEYAGGGAARIYFGPGTGVATVKDFIHHSGQKGESYIFELDIKSVSPITGTQVTSPVNTVGQTCGYVQKPVGEYFLQNMIQIISALTGVTYEALAESAAKSEFKAARVKAGILGEKATWSVADEFLAFIDDLATKGTLKGRDVKFSCKPSKSDPTRAYPNFYAANDS